jgi:Zn-dependent protease
MERDKIILNQSRKTSSKVFTTLGSTPVTYQGWSWVPGTQLLAWIFFTRQAAKRKPTDTIFHWTAEGFLKTIVTLGAEWCHNLAHALASNLIGQPMDELRVQFGMPRCIYYEINDLNVTPRQHLVRALGGSLINLLLLPISWLYRRTTQPDTIPGETAKLFFQTNLFLSLISLLPIPGIDGGPILKWSLVEGGSSIQEADEVVRKVNGPLALILGLFSSWSFGKKRIFAGFFSAMLGMISLGVFTGWLKEDEVSI